RWRYSWLPSRDEQLVVVGKIHRQRRQLWHLRFAVADQRAHFGESRHLALLEQQVYRGFDLTLQGRGCQMKHPQVFQGGLPLGKLVDQHLVSPTPARRRKQRVPIAIASQSPRLLDQRP